MPHSPYLPERQSEFWTSRQVEEFYLDSGFEVLIYPLDQLTENKMPADFIFFDEGRSKLFGLQYKALYHNGDDHWPLSEEQHKMLSKYPWIYYCLSEMKVTSEHRTALHHARVLHPRFPFRGQVYSTWSLNSELGGYSRWAAFFKGVESCRNGVKVKSADHLIQLVTLNSNDNRLESVASNMVDMFLSDFGSKRVIHYSPALNNLRAP